MNKKSKNFLISIIITLIFIIFCVVVYYTQINKYSVDAFESKADYLFYNEDYINAAKYYNKLLSMGKHSNKNSINLAISLIKIENYKYAIKHLDILLKTNTNLPEAYYLMALSIYKQLEKENLNEGNIKQIISYLEKSLELNDRYKISYLLIGEIYEKINLYEQARTYYKKALFSDIENSEEFYGFIAHTYFKEENFTDAIKYYKKAIEKNKNYISAYCCIADIYTIQEEYDKAKETYEQIINQDSDYILPYYKIGNLYYIQENYKEAIAWYKKALLINKDNELVNYYIGVCYKKMNNFLLASKYLKIAAYRGSDEAIEELRTIPENDNVL